MINPSCVRCRKELEEPGAIVLSSPMVSGHVAKYHICKECEKSLAVWLMELILDKSRKLSINNVIGRWKMFKKVHGIHDYTEIVSCEKSIVAYIHKLINKKETNE